jgi:hypothetical protein
VHARYFAKGNNNSNNNNNNNNNNSKNAAAVASLLVIVTAPLSLLESVLWSIGYYYCWSANVLRFFIHRTQDPKEELLLFTVRPFSTVEGRRIIKTKFLTDLQSI